MGTVLATGTPMKNGRPVNLLPLLAGIRHPLASNKMTFEMRYCNARKTKFCPWDTSGASNLVELQEKLGGKLIRKTKVGAACCAALLLDGNYGSGGGGAFISVMTCVGEFVWFCVV